MPHGPSCSCTHSTCTRSHREGYRLYSTLHGWRCAEHSGLKNVTLRRALTRLEAERDEQQRGRPDA